MKDESTITKYLIKIMICGFALILLVVSFYFGLHFLKDQFYGIDNKTTAEIISIKELDKVQDQPSVKLISFNTKHTFLSTSYYALIESKDKSISEVQVKSNSDLIYQSYLGKQIPIYYLTNSPTIKLNVKAKYTDNSGNRKIIEKTINANYFEYLHLKEKLNNHEKIQLKEIFM